MKWVLDQLHACDVRLGSVLVTQAPWIVYSLLAFSGLLALRGAMSVRRSPASSKVLLLWAALFLGWAGLIARAGTPAHEFGWALLATACAMAFVWSVSGRGNDTSSGA